MVPNVISIVQGCTDPPPPLTQCCVSISLLVDVSRFISTYKQVSAWEYGVYSPYFILGYMLNILVVAPGVELQVGVVLEKLN